MYVFCLSCPSTTFALHRDGFVVASCKGSIKRNTYMLITVTVCAEFAIYL